MISIKIDKDVRDKAIKDMKDFDAQKTYNKFTCSNNWTGLLGEMVLNNYFISKQKEVKWFDFIKGSWKFPDFIYNEKTIDLKTRSGLGMWFTKPVFDIYIYARLSKSGDYLYLISWITKEEMVEAMDNGKAKQVRWKNRNDYVINEEDMNPIETLEVLQ